MAQAMAEDGGRVPMSPGLQATLLRAREYAASQSEAQVLLEHLLLSLTEDADAANVLEACQVDMGRLRNDVAGYVGTLNDRVPPGTPGAPAISPQLTQVLKYATLAAQQGKRSSIDGAIVLAALVGDGRSMAASFLKAQGLTFEAAIQALRDAAIRTVAQPEAPRAAPMGAPPPPHYPPPQSHQPYVAQQQPPYTPHQPPGAPLRADDILARARERVESRATHRPDPQAPAPPQRFDPPPAPTQPPFEPMHDVGTPPPPPYANGIDAHPPAPRVDFAPPHVSAPADVAPTDVSPPPADDVAHADLAAPEVQPDTDLQPETVAAPAEPPPAEPETQARSLPEPLPDSPVEPLPEPAPRAHDDPQPARAATPAEPPRPPPRPVAAAHPPTRPTEPHWPPHPPQGGSPAPPSGWAPPPTRGPPGATSPGAPHPGRPYLPSPPPSHGWTAPPQPPQGSWSSPAPEPRELAPPPPGYGAHPAQLPPQGSSYEPGAAGRRPAVDAGQISHSLPHRMKQGRPQTIEVRIERPSLAGTGSASRSYALRPETVVARAIAVRLRPMSGRFIIDAGSPETQWDQSGAAGSGRLASEAAVWRFTVTPLNSGRGVLQLGVSARTLGADGVLAETQLPDQAHEVRVSREYADLAKRAALLLAVGVGSIVLLKLVESLLGVDLYFLFKQLLRL